MPLSIKLQCGCGQRYAFEVEPVDGRMPSTVGCPSCGADGTDAANEMIAQNSVPPPAPPAAVKKTLRVSIAAHTEPSAPSAALAPQGGAKLPGQVDRAKAEKEARAKTAWGDPPEEVTKYLMMQGFSPAEAAVLVKELFQERAAMVRSNGLGNIILGVGLILVPIVSYVIFAIIGVIYIKLLALAVMVGLYGLWKLANGLFMFVAPKSDYSDIADQ